MPLMVKNLITKSFVVIFAAIQDKKEQEALPLLCLNFNNNKFILVISFWLPTCNEADKVSSKFKFQPR